jgi:ADP-ribose pyrophosphatase YjhB (NUDIX family)
MNGRPELCVGAVVVDDERLLLVRRGTDPGRGRWSLPGGRVEAGESMVAAVLRELLEETGMEGLCGPFVGWVERMDVDHHFVIVDFWVNVLDDGPLSAGSDADEVAWVAFDELVHADLVEGLADFLVDQEIVPADVFPL